MSWWNIIDFRSGNIDKRWLPVMVLVVFLAAALVRWAADHFGGLGVLLVLVPLGLLAALEAKMRKDRGGDASGNPDA